MAWRGWWFVGARKSLPLWSKSETGDDAGIYIRRGGWNKKAWLERGVDVTDVEMGRWADVSPRIGSGVEPAGCRRRGDGVDDLSPWPGVGARHAMRLLVGGRTGGGAGARRLGKQSHACKSNGPPPWTAGPELPKQPACGPNRTGNRPFSAGTAAPALQICR